jgi:phosphate transport system permease protein
MASPIKLLRSGDVFFRVGIFVFALIIPLLLFSFFIALTVAAFPAIQRFGVGFIFGTVWDPVKEIFGALPFIYGTLISSALALLIAVPLGLGTAIYLSEVSSSKIREVISQMVELLAAIPSVVYGLWGIFVLGPLLVNYLAPFLQILFGFSPLFSGPVFGLSMFSGGIILAIMILPTITAVSREVFQAIPQSLRESALALGTTKWETVKLAVFPPAKSGIIGGIILGLGRALGETMAITMVIGNRPEISFSLFAPGYSLAAVIANEFTEATTDIYLSSLIEIGLILLIITLTVNALARFLVWKTTQREAHI